MNDRERFPFLATFYPYAVEVIQHLSWYSQVLRIRGLATISTFTS